MGKKLLLYGPPGSGKTHASCLYAPKPVLLLDMDGKAHDTEALLPSIASGDLIVRSLNLPLTQERLRFRNFGGDGKEGMQITKRPEGYNKIIDTLNACIDHHSETPPYATLVLDSVTKLLEHLKRVICYYNKRPTLVEHDWGIFLANLEEVFGALMPMTENIIVIAHEMMVRDEITGGIKSILPLIEGQMRNKVVAYFPEAWHTEPILMGDQNKTRYRVRTSASDLVSARTGKLSLDPVMDIKEAFRLLWPSQDKEVIPPIAIPV